MKELSLIVSVSILLIACGSNAENSVSEKKEPVKQEKITAEQQEKVVDEVIQIEEKTIELGSIKEEKSKKKRLKENIIKEVKETPKEVVEEENPVVIEVIRAKHDVWNSLTKNNVTAAGKVNYRGMKAQLNKITTYLEHLQQTIPKKDWSKNEKLAYWINLYNASTVYLIASNYPTTSIKKLNGGKPWDKKFVKSGNKTYSLNDIENNIVRSQFKDPRVHAALNCAAVSCPKMLNGAFLPGKLSAQLNKQCVAWINDENRNVVTPNSLKLSQIFDWYKVDFESNGGVIAFIGKYNKSKIIINPTAKISYLAYNWKLNE